jgi:hypothetical protein
MAEQSSGITKVFSHELGYDLTFINNTSFSNYDRWRYILIFAYDFSGSMGFYSKLSNNTLLCELTGDDGSGIDLYDSAVVGFLDMLDISQYDFETLTVFNVKSSIFNLDLKNVNIQKYDVNDGVCKILNASIDPGGLSELKKLMKALHIEDFGSSIMNNPCLVIDEQDRLKSNGKACQVILGLESEDMEEKDSDYAYYEYDQSTFYISSSIESCYKNFSKSINTLRTEQGNPKDFKLERLALTKASIGINGDKIIEFEPTHKVLLFSDIPVVLKNIDFRVRFTSKSPDNIKHIKSIQDPFHRKLRAKMLESDLGM